MHTSKSIDNECVAPDIKGAHHHSRTSFQPALVVAKQFCLNSASLRSCPPRTQQESMASTVMANHAVAVAGLGSSMVRGTPMGGLQGPLKMSKSSRQVFTPIRAAKLPPGIETPRTEPKLPVSFWGFTENAEVWNSRASMIGIFGIIIVEAIIHKGILQAIGIEVGNGLDLPL